MFNYKIDLVNTVTPSPVERRQRGEVIGRKYFVFIFFLLLTATSSAQLVGTTIIWKVESVRDVVTGLPSNQFGDVIVRPDRIEFFPSPSLPVGTAQTYAIKKTDTSWTDLAQDGRAIFQVENGNKKGSVIITKTNGKVWIALASFDQATKTMFDFKCSGHELVTP